MLVRHQSRGGVERGPIIDPVTGGKIEEQKFSSENSTHE
jgi:hypothetical protein